MQRATRADGDLRLLLSIESIFHDGILLFAPLDRQHSRLPERGAVSWLLTRLIDIRDDGGTRFLDASLNQLPTISPSRRPSAGFSGLAPQIRVSTVTAGCPDDQPRTSGTAASIRASSRRTGDEVAHKSRRTL